jgi:hypothetical protein
MVAMTRNLFPVFLCVLLLSPVGGPLAAQPRFENSITISGGLYAASGIGTNSYFAGRYNYFILGGRYSVEAALGFGSLQSKVLSTVSRAQLFSSETLLTYEFSFAYDPMPSGNIPYLLFGVAGVRQGGEALFAGVVGIGKRIPLPGLFGSSAFGVRYDLRDQIFSQQLNNSDPFLSHNIVATLGFQIYF